MKSCAKIKRLLSGYLDNEIDSAADAALVKEHLDSCSFCKKELSELSRVKKLILEKERKFLPQDYLVYRLKEEIADERLAEEKLSWFTGIGNLSRRLIPVPVAAVALSIILLILSSSQTVDKYSLEEHILSGTQTTTEIALGLILGAGV
ncbi:MAG: zf-HC2 domain-containing protein [Candidatus Omnitrophota bacterium]